MRQMFVEWMEKMILALQETYGKYRCGVQAAAILGDGGCRFFQITVSVNFQAFAVAFLRND